MNINCFNVTVRSSKTIWWSKRINHRFEVDALSSKCYRYQDEIYLLKLEHNRNITAIRKEYDEKITSYENRVSDLNDKIENLENENKKLKSQLNKNSSNSGKPPSSDGFKKPVNTRKPSGKKPGGQVGHDGKTAEPMKPTKFTDIKLKLCSCGGHYIYEERPLKTKQQVDIYITYEVNEFGIYRGHCDKCGEKIVTEFPDGINNPVNYGDNIKSLVTIGTVDGASSIKRFLRFLNEATGRAIKLSAGSVVNFRKELSEKLTPFIDSVKENLIRDPVIHKDETGVKLNGKTNWCHILCNIKMSYYMIHEKIGNEVDKAMDVLTGYSGTLMHDHYKTLYNFNCKHAECNIHAIRYLIGIIENEPEYKGFAEELKDLLNEMNNAKKKDMEKGITKFPRETILQYEQSINKY